MADRAVVKTPRCCVCGNTSEAGPVDLDGLARWHSGALIQEALPELSADDRELLISGTHPLCWDDLTS
jgi:hypothetical protein